jgi:hypothetical protein
MFPPFGGAPLARRSVGEALAIPHTFNPSLTFFGALIAVVSSITRILLGCMLFAVWGVGASAAWSRIHNHILGSLAMILLILLFLALFASLMIAISTVVSWIVPHHHS